jgi:hypothetical protein
MNCGATQYHTRDRTMEELEQEAVREVVRGQLNSYEINATSNRQVEKETEHNSSFFFSCSSDSVSLSVGLRE